MSTGSAHHDSATPGHSNDLGASLDGLYDAAHERDACGLGFVAHIKGIKSHAIIEQGLKILRTWTTAARSAPTS
jgi:hypothetical protein